MQRREISKALLLASAGAVALTETAQAQTCTAPCYAVIPAETAAGVTVYQNQYPPGDIRRYYGGEVDWTLALSRLNSVWKQGVACFIPTGTYPYTTSPNWFVASDSLCGTSGHPKCVTMQLTGERGAVLQHTGSGVAFNISNGTTGAASVPITISNIIISGNSNTTEGFSLQGVVSSYFRMIEVRNVAGKAFAIRFGVRNQFDTCSFSTNNFPSTVLPTHGFYIDHDPNPGNYSTLCTFTNCYAEGFPGTGVEIAKGSSNAFIGCTFEAVSIGITIKNDSMNNRFQSLWFEANSTADVQILGGVDGSGNPLYCVGNNFSTCNSFSLSSQPNISVVKGQATMFEGGFLRQVELQSTSRDTLFLGTVFSNWPGLGIIGTGSYKMIGGTKADGNGFVTATLPNV